MHDYFFYRMHFSLPIIYCIFPKFFQPLLFNCKMSEALIRGSLIIRIIFDRLFRVILIYDWPLYATRTNWQGFVFETLIFSVSLLKSKLMTKKNKSCCKIPFLPISTSTLPIVQLVQWPIQRWIKSNNKPPTEAFPRCLLVTWKQESGQKVEQIFRKSKSLVKQCNFKAVLVEWNQNDVKHDAFTICVTSNSFR